MAPLFVNFPPSLSLLPSLLFIKQCALKRQDCSVLTFERSPRQVSLTTLIKQCALKRQDCCVLTFERRRRQVSLTTLIKQCSVKRQASLTTLTKQCALKRHKLHDACLISSERYVSWAVIICTKRCNSSTTTIKEQPSNKPKVPPGEII